MAASVVWLSWNETSAAWAAAGAVAAWGAVGGDVLEVPGGLPRYAALLLRLAAPAVLPLACCALARGLLLLATNRMNATRCVLGVPAGSKMDRFMAVARLVRASSCVNKAQGPVI